MCLDAPNDIMQVKLLEERKVIVHSVEGYDLPTDPKHNTAGAPLLAILEEIDQNIGFEVSIRKLIKPGSGIGSSAASAAGAVVAANHLLGDVFAKEDLVRFAMIGEKVASGVKHADNIAPCIYGGITLIRSIFPLDIVEIPVPALQVTVVHPQIEVMRTSDTWANPSQRGTPERCHARQWGNIGGLIAGLMKNDYELIGRSLEDVIIEPAAKR